MLQILSSGAETFSRIRTSWVHFVYFFIISSSLHLFAFIHALQWHNLYQLCVLHLLLVSFDFMNARVLIFKLNSTMVFSGNSGIIQLHQFVCCYRTADKSSAVFPFISLEHRHQSCSSLLSWTQKPLREPFSGCPDRI